MKTIKDNSIIKSFLSKILTLSILILFSQNCLAQTSNGEDLKLGHYYLLPLVDPFTKFSEQINEDLLQEVNSILEENVNYNIEIIVKRDCFSDYKYAEFITNAWAIKVENYILENGISKDRVNIISLGAFEPKCVDCSLCDDIRKIYIKYFLSDSATE
ncbi:MAG: hypothetical protein ACPG4Z_00785 [Chitinophagales bacterium]